MIADETPPMSRTIRRFREVAGISQAELGRLVGYSQAAFDKYETEREPRYSIVVEIEKALDLPRGTLFAAAGYAPTLNASEAVAMDPSLDADQRQAVNKEIVRARGRRSAKTQVDSAALVLADESLPESDRREIARLIESLRYVNRSKRWGEKH